MGRVAFTTLPLQAITTVLCLALVATKVHSATPSKTCVYRQSANTVTCYRHSPRGETLSSYTTKVAVPKKKLPKGTYRLGPATTKHPVPWYNLYPIEGSAVWDYHSPAPFIKCRAGFGFHRGTVSEGCISVPTAAWSSINAYLGSNVITETVKAKECRFPGCRCIFGKCGCARTGTVKRTMHKSTSILVYSV